MFSLSSLEKVVQKHNKRVGRGQGSNRGKNSGKGHKGQNKHGQGVRAGFEGGQKPLIQRLPKYSGFKALDRKNSAVLNLNVLSKYFKDGDKITLEALSDKQLITKFVKKVRIINTGKLDKKLDVDQSQIYLTKGAESVLNNK